MKSLTIDTSRLRLAAGTALLTKLAITNKTEFSKQLGASVPTNWPEELMVDAEPWVADVLEKDPESAGWWIWYVVRRRHLDQGDTLIGTVGLKGRPDSDGKVEAGWGMLEQFRCHGYATEAALALMDWAFADQRVTCITAETYPDLASSIRIMEKCGMSPVGKGSEEIVIRYQLLKRRS
jgi:ribosomal-protein-alanine N-acetyltransferase